MAHKASDYDTLDCPRCDTARRPKRINPSGSARYSCNCGDGIRYGWTINLDGDIANETQVLTT